MVTAASGVFSANPLSLSVPEPAFETWLRDTGYLEILDERISSSSSSGGNPPATTTTRSSSNSTFSPSPFSATNGTTSSSASGFLLRDNIKRRSGSGGLGVVFSNSAVVSVVRTLLSILSINPFAKLTAADFSGSTPSWTVGFLSGGQTSSSSYSWPAGSSQARMRVHENVKRYARNYAFLSLLFLACSLYKMPVALLGLVSSLALWEALRMCSYRWALEERHPVLRHALVRITQLATAIILYFCKLQMVLICAISVSYTVMILHASLRKLTPSKQSIEANRYK